MMSDILHSEVHKFKTDYFVSDPCQFWMPLLLCQHESICHFLSGQSKMAYSTELVLLAGAHVSYF